MASIDLIRFSVEGQKLDYIQKYYFSTQTIDTLYCNFNFKTDDLGHVYGGWDLPYLWTQFKDKQGNVYIKQVTADNTCSIPYSCLRQRDFRMTLFATDTEDYMVCNKRYTTNEVVFKFKGNANLNYDGGVDPDDPVPTQWQILLDRVDECESTVEGLSQDVSALQETVDGLSQEVATMGDNIEGLDDRVIANANAIDGLSQDITSIHGSLDNLNTDLDAERIARENADANLQSAINDRYTKAETDTLINAESTARANADADLQSAIQEEATTRSEAIEGVNDTTNELNTKLDNESTTRENEDTRLESLISDRYTKTETDTLLDAKQDSLSDSQLAAVNSGLTSNDKTTLDSLSQSVPSIQDAVDELSTGLANESTARANADTRIEGLVNDESTARENADADLRLLINDEVNERTSSYNAINTRVKANEDAIEDTNATVELLYKTLKKDNSWTELSELVRSGKAEQFLNYGDQIEENWLDVDNNNKEYSNPWDVAKFEDVETRESTIHGMFLKQHWATLRPIQLSHNRAFYACKDGLSAGTYHITLGADWGTNAKKDKSYQFTITNDVPTSGRLAGFYSMPDVAPQNWKVYVYDANGIDILENAITVTEGTDGTFLGTLKFNTRDGNLNSMQETAYGNNDWEISAYRQYLNSRKGKGEWWIAQDEWDIAPDQLKTVSGFLCGISDELYNSMQTVKVKTWKNNPTHGGVESYTYDKVFLPSKEELYYTPQKAGEGTYYPLMKEQLGLDSPLADYTAYAPNITYAIENHSSAQYVRLRSAGLGVACGAWYAGTSGSVNHGNSVTNADRCTPVCVIG